MSVTADPATQYEPAPTPKPAQRADEGGSKPSRLPAVLAVLGLAAAGAVATAYYADVPVFGSKVVADPAASYTVEATRGPLVISIVETGTIKAAEQSVIKSLIEGSATIIDLVPEGTHVKEGDLLVTFDVSTLENDKLTGEIAVRNDESDLVQAQEELAVALNQAKADISAAELEYRFAVEDHKKYLQGDFPKELKEAENEITIADEELRRSTEQRKGSERLYEAGFISLTELEADRLSERKNQLTLDVAKQARDLLAGWTHRRKIDEFESDIEQKEMALERAKRKAAADIAQAEARLASQEANLRREQQRLDNINKQIAGGQLFAPSDGMVVYATSGRGGWRGNEEPLMAGQSVRERQELINLPTERDRIAEISIHESSLDKISTGMRARITVDAMPGKTFWGTVETIAPLPDASVSFFNPDLKVYPTQIRIKGDDLDLRTGMSCRAEIVIDRFDDAVSVPVQSVVRIGGEQCVFIVDDNGQLEQRKVITGLDDNSRVVIAEGLEEGERVTLTPPLGDTIERDAIDDDDLPDEVRQATEGDGYGPPTTKPAAVDPSTLEPVTVSDFMEAREIMQERMSPTDMAQMQKFMEEGDPQKMMGFSRAMMAKYKVTLEGGMPGMPGGPRGGEGAEEGQGGPGGQGGDDNARPQGAGQRDAASSSGDSTAEADDDE